MSTTKAFDARCKCGSAFELVRDPTKPRGDNATLVTYTPCTTHTTNESAEASAVVLPQVRAQAFLAASFAKADKTDRAKAARAAAAAIASDGWQCSLVVNSLACRAVTTGVRTRS